MDGSCKTGIVVARGVEYGHKVVLHTPWLPHANQHPSEGTSVRERVERMMEPYVTLFATGRGRRWWLVRALCVAVCVSWRAKHLKPRSGALAVAVRQDETCKYAQEFGQPYCLRLARGDVGVVFASPR